MLILKAKCDGCGYEEVLVEGFNPAANNYGRMFSHPPTGWNWLSGQEYEGERILCPRCVAVVFEVIKERKGK